MTIPQDQRFACKCCGKNWIDPRLVELVRRLEERIGQRLKINSGYRCEAHNAAVGGSETSSHLKGLAVDVAVDGSRQRYQIIHAAIQEEIHRIGIGRSFIHMDIDRSKDPMVVWLY
jgi:zinc D-Ala-D-Ala carboxypeptidase